MSQLDFKFSKIKEAYEIYTNSSYDIGSEFRYRYNEDLSNDNFLLYYGFVIKKTLIIISYLNLMLLMLDLIFINI
jgi:hypothetical protein